MVGGANDLREGVQLDLEAPRGIDLRHQIDVGEVGAVAEAVVAALDQCLDRREALRDPVPDPGRAGGIVGAECLPQVD